MENRVVVVVPSFDTYVTVQAYTDQATYQERLPVDASEVIHHFK